MRNRMARFAENAGIPKGLRDVFARSGVSLSIADYTAPDCPLIGVNEAFCRMSGYSAAEVLGRNCRFLQPPGNDMPVRERMRDFINDAEQADGRFLIPNIRKDGRPFLNLVYMAKLARDGRDEFILGSQFPIEIGNTASPDVYDRALTEDLRQINILTTGDNWAVLGSFEALASSHSIIARANLV